jgi:hypothetical protein
MKFLKWFFESESSPEELPKDIQEFVYNMAPYNYAVRFVFPTAAKRSPGEFVLTGSELQKIFQDFYSKAAQVLRDSRLERDYRKQLYDYIKYNLDLINDFLMVPENLDRQYVVYTNRPGQRFGESKLNASNNGF